VKAKISVRVGTPRGLDSEEDVRGALQHATQDLVWKAEKSDEPPGLSGITDILLVALIEVPTKMALDAIVKQVSEVLSAWRGKRMDPPPTNVEVEELEVDVEEPEADRSPGEPGGSSDDRAG
jgi:hypothetical protein